MADAVFDGLYYLAGHADTGIVLSVLGGGGVVAVLWVMVALIRRLK